MTTSTETAALAAALLKAQRDMKNPGFDSTNPHFRSKYASLVSVRDAVLPCLHKHGLALTQSPTVQGDMAGISWRLIHGETGQWMAGEVLLPMDKKNAHGVGSAITYATRYTMQSLGCVVGDEDDDGNSAADRPSKPQDEPKRDNAPDTLAKLKKLLGANVGLAEDYFRNGADKRGRNLGWLGPEEGIDSLALNHAQAILGNFEAFTTALDNYAKTKA